MPMRERLITSVTMWMPPNVRSVAAVPAAAPTATESSARKKGSGDRYAIPSTIKRRIAETVPSVEMSFFAESPANPE